MLALLDLFTCESISPIMWQMFGVVFEAFNRDGLDYFSGKWKEQTQNRILKFSPTFFFCLEMMAVMYNFIRIDTDTFLTNPKHIQIIIAMSKSVSRFFQISFYRHKGTCRRPWGRPSDVCLQIT